MDNIRPARAIVRTTPKGMLRLAGALLLGAVAATTLVGQRADAAPAATKTVAYQGRAFQVPGSWPVVDLTASPTSCVRFDVSAVYLGSPPTEQNCPAGLRGRADSLLLEPAPQSTAAAVTEVNDAAQQLTSTASGIRATATYHHDRASAQSILTSAGLPVALRQAAAPATTLSAASGSAAAVSSDLTNFHGKGFDPCTAPSTSTMNAWKSASPYGAIGVYIGGVNRSCSQPNLTASWVSTQAAAGWKLFPLYVGLQAPSSACGGCSIITSPNSQGKAAADDAADKAAGLGMSGVVIYFDMESYSTMNNTTALAFESAWTQQLHARGYRSGIYTSASTGVVDLVNHAGSYTLPDVIDFADWNGSADTVDSHFPSTAWANHQRIHQYSGGHNETYGGITINIDSDYLDVSLGTMANVAPPEVSDTAVIGPFGDLQEFRRGSDGTLRRWAWSAAAGWFVKNENMGGSITGTPVAMLAPDNTLQVYARGTDGTLRQWAFTTTGGWSVSNASLSGSITDDPEVVIGPFGDMLIFAHGTDNTLRSWAFNFTTGWTGQNSSLGGSIGGAPKALLGPDNILQVYVRGTDNTLRHWAFTTSSGWAVNNENLGGSIADRPDVTVGPFGDMQIYARGTDNTLRSWAFNFTTGWTGQNSSLGGSIGGAPDALLGPDNILQVYVRGTDNTLRHWAFTTSSGWAVNNENLGGSIADRPDVMIGPLGDMQIYARGTDNTLRHWAWNYTTGWIVNNETLSTI